MFLAVILAPLLVHYAPFLFSERCYVSSDHHLFFEPFCTYIGKAFKSGHLPLWNPFLYFGMPQFSLPSPSYIYPPTLLYSVFNYSQALSIQQIIHHAAAAIGGALLVESLGLSFAAAVCGGIAYAFSGYMFTLSANYSLVAGASWLPFALYASRQIKVASKREHQAFWTMLMAIFVFLMISAGRPEVFVPVIVIVGVHTITSFLRFALPNVNSLTSEPTAVTEQLSTADQKPQFKVFCLRIIALAIGGFLCMPLLLPALEWASTSARAKGLDVNEVMMWSSNWYNFSTVLLAQPFGDLQTLGNGFLPAAADRAAYMPFLPSAYVGAAVITLALFAIIERKSPWLVPSLVLLMVGILFSAGRFTPVLPWLVTHVTQLSVFRYPVKLLILPIMAICILAAFGMHAARDNQISLKTMRIMAISWVVVMIAGLLLIFFGKHWLTMQSVNASVKSEIAIALGIAIFHAAAIGLTMVAICIFRTRKMIGTFGFTAFTIALISIDLLGTAMRFPPLSAPEIFISKKPALVEMLERQVGVGKANDVRVLNLYYDPLSAPMKIFDGEPIERTIKYYRYCRDLLVCNSNIDYGIHEAFGYEGTVSAKYRRLVLNLINDMRNADVEESNGSKRAQVFEKENYDERMRRYVNASGLQFVAGQISRDGAQQDTLSSEEFEIVEDNRNFNLRLYKVKNPKPRVELVENWTWVNNLDQAYRFLNGDDRKKTDLAMMPVIEKGSEHKADYPLGFVKVSERNARPTCELLNDKSEHISVAVNSPRPCMLLLRDQHYPGWKALIDSVAVPIYRANGFTRAVYIPAGAHAVEFNYKPDSLKYGVRIALVALAAFAVLAFLAFAPSVWRFVKWTAGQK